MSSLSVDDSPHRARAGTILLGAVAGFALGEVAAALLVALAAAVAHYPGGLTALAKVGEPPWWVNALSLAGLWVGFATAIYVASTSGHLAALPRQWQIRASDWLYVVLGVVLQGLVGLAYRPFHFKHLNQPVNHLFGGARGVTFALIAIMTTFGAPLMEEWFFRGVLYRGLREAVSSLAPRATSGVASGVAVVVSAVLFALAHGEALQFVGLACLGVVLALLVQRTQRLVPSVITHISFNGVAMVALVVQRWGH